MKETSRTGLLASPTKKFKLIKRNEVSEIYFKIQKLKYYTSEAWEEKVQLKAVVGPAPFILKPFAGLYNPYPYGCSLLCNHPRDSDSKELVKRAKDTWASEGKNLLLVEEVEAIRNNFENLKFINSNENKFTLYKDEVQTFVDSVPEELFRRYTETDSRPLTPTPTLISSYTRASASRRCITPDPALTAEIKEKTMLILDLRRSHSQDTISWYGGSSLYQEPPLIKIFPAPLTDGGCSSFRSTKSVTEEIRKKISKIRPNPIVTKINVIKDKIDKSFLSVESDGRNAEPSEKGFIENEEEEPLRRRGKRRRKKGRDSSRGPPAFQSSLDPETQISALDPDSLDPSKRPSISINSQDGDSCIYFGGKSSELLENFRKSSLEVESFLDKDVLRHLRRQLNEEMIDYEFDNKKRRALQEALKTVDSQKKDCEKLQKLKQELNLPSSNTEYILSLSRVFSRSSARFELPMDSRTFEKMTPIDYLKENVVISSARKLLYKCIFNKHRHIQEQEKFSKRVLKGNKLVKALGEIMGKELSENQAKYFLNLLECNNDDEFDFQTFCGISALCERILAPEFCVNLSSKEEDPCNELERVDFESLSSRLDGLNIKENILKILYGIKNI